MFGLKELQEKAERLLFGATAEERVAMQVKLAELAARRVLVRALAEDDADECWANARSLAAIPAGELPDVAARAELVARALAGEDVYAYIPAAHDGYVLWVRQPDPAAEARIAPAEWARRWRAAGMPVGGAATQAQEGGAA